MTSKHSPLKRYLGKTLA